MTDQFRRLALAALLILGTLLAIGTFGSSSQGPSKKPFRPKLYPLSGSKGHIYPEVKYTVAPENANGKRVVITGGAGFIGSQLGWHLHNKGYEVTLIDNMRFGYADNLNVNGKQFGRFILGDVLDTRIWEYLKGADTVFHFAALSALPVCQMHPRDAMDVNVAGVANVLEGVRQMGVRRFVFASTSAVYEANKDEVLTEDLKVTPHLHYSLSKYQSELLVNAMAATYGLDVSIMRFFNVYGPHQDMRRTSPPFTSYIARELAANRVPVLHSDGKQRRDYVHVDDLMRLAMLIMESPKAKGETFNVASGKTHSVNEMFAMVKKETKATVEPVYHSAQDFWAAYKELFAGDRPIKKEILEAEVNKRTLGSFEKAKRLLGWEPKVSMEDGLRGLVQYVKEARARGVVEAPVAWKV